MCIVRSKYPLRRLLVHLDHDDRRDVSFQVMALKPGASLNDFECAKHSKVIDDLEWARMGHSE